MTSAFVVQLVEQLQNDYLRDLRESWNEQPILRDYRFGVGSDGWAVFFYRFVDPESRRGADANYASRLLGAHVYVSPDSGWTVYHLPRLPISRRD